MILRDRARREALLFRFLFPPLPPPAVRTILPRPTCGTIVFESLSSPSLRCNAFTEKPFQAKVIVQTVRDVMRDYSSRGTSLPTDSVGASADEGESQREGSGA